MPFPSPNDVKNLELKHDGMEWWRFEYQDVVYFDFCTMDAACDSLERAKSKGTNYRMTLANNSHLEELTYSNIWSQVKYPPQTS